MVIIAVVGLFGGTLFYLYNKSKSKPVTFATETPFYTDIIKKTVATGSVVPRKQVDVKPQISGIIEQLFVEPGQSVRKGDLLARVKIIPNMVNLNNAESRVNRARISLEDTRRAYERQKVLFEDQVIALTEYQQYELSYLNALEELQSAENNLQLIREGVATTGGETSTTLIRSTIDGMILEVPVEVGHSVIETNNFNAGTTIATIADMGQIVFKGKVDESEVGKLREGIPLFLTIGAIADEKFEAVLEHISPKGVEESGAIQFEIRAALKLKENFFIRAGYSANADIVLDKRENVLAINERLLLFENDSVFVEVETTSQSFEKRPIKLGLSDGINVEVVEGLTVTDRVKIL